MKAQKKLDLLQEAENDVYYGGMEDVKLTHIPADEPLLKEMVTEAKATAKVRDKADKMFERTLNKAIKVTRKIVDKEEASE